MEKGRVGMFMFYGDNLSNFPPVANCARIWARNGFFVDIIMHPSGEAFSNYFKESNINIVTFSFPFKETAFLTHRNKYLSWAMRKIRYFFYIKNSLSYCKDKQYKYFIGFDPEGLIAATILSKLLKIKTPVVYHSLELLSLDTNSLRAKFNKYLEKRCNKRAIYTIIQDENRAELLMKENEIRREKILIVPNTNIGTLTNKIKDNDNHWRRRFGIEESKKIILYAGCLSQWAELEKLIKSIEFWPDDAVFLLHGWCSDDDYFELLRRTAEPYKDKVIFSSVGILPEDEYDHLVSSASIGVAWYKKSILNIFHIGASSGKVFQYLRCGVPVITNDLPDFKKLIEGNNCGICVSSEREIGEAIRKILADHEIYSQNAFKCFEKYEFSKSYQAVIDKLETEKSKIVKGGTEDK